MRFGLWKFNSEDEKDKGNPLIQPEEQQELLQIREKNKQEMDERQKEKLERLKRAEKEGKIFVKRVDDLGDEESDSSDNGAEDDQK